MGASTGVATGNGGGDWKYGATGSAPSQEGQLGTGEAGADDVAAMEIRRRRRPRHSQVGCRVESESCDVVISKIWRSAVETALVGQDAGSLLRAGANPDPGCSCGHIEFEFETGVIS